MVLKCKEEELVTGRGELSTKAPGRDSNEKKKSLKDTGINTKITRTCFIGEYVCFLINTLNNEIEQ